MVSVDKIYAVSLIDVSYEKNLQDTILQELLDIKILINENKDIIKLLNSPVIPKKEKMKILDNIFLGRLSDYTLNFLKVLPSNDRFDRIINIIEEFKNEYNERNNICEIEVETAVEMSEEQIKIIVSKFGQKLNKKIRVFNKVNNGILGGVIINLNNKQIDASVKSDIKNIFNEITKSMA